MMQASNTFILALGPVGYWIAETYQEQLRTRHPNQSTPSIEILALLEEEQTENMSLPTLIIRPKEEPELVDLLSSLYPEQVPQGADTHQVLEQLYNQHRLRGQVSLHQHLHAIEQQLQEAHQRITSIETTNTLADQNITLINPNQTHVFVLLSLADPFMSGLMPDLAYVIQNSLKAGVSHNSFIHIHLVLLLPGFDGEINLNANNPQQKAEGEFTINAWAAASLKEIDYYLARGYRYYHRFNPQSRFSLSIESHHSPLGNGQIYLLEPANEKQNRLNNVRSMAHMVSNWLYHVTLTPLHYLLDSPVITPGARYGSFGNTTLSVPIASWIKRADIQLQLDLLQQLLKPPETNITPIDISNTRARLHLTERDIRHKLTFATEYEDLTMQSSFALQVPQTESHRFLNTIQKRYSQIMQKKMPILSEAMFTRMHSQMVPDAQGQDARIVGELKDYVQYLLNDLKGGLSRTAIFLEKLHDMLQQESKQLAGSQEQLKKGGQALQKNVEARRQTYFNHAQIATAIGPIPFAPAFLLIVFGVLPIFALSWRVFQNNGPMWAGGVLLLNISLALLIWSWTYSTLQTSRQRVVQIYEQRLRAFREADLLSARRRLYDEIMSWIGGIREGVSELPQQLVRIRTGLTEHQKEEQLNDVTRFSGIMPSAISESLLTPQLMSEFEKKARTAGLEGEIEAMRQQLGTPNQWIKEEWDEEKLADKLKKFAYQRVSQQLRQYELDQLLKLIPPRQLESKLTRMIQISQPYWQHNSARVPPHQVVALANSDSHRELLEDLFPTSQILSIEEPYELIVACIRHGFTLPQINTFTDVLMRHYKILAHTAPDALHTTIDRRILPILPQDVTVSGISLLNYSVRHLCAVAFGTKIIFTEFDEFYWEDEKMQEKKLNGTLTDILLEMAHNEDLQTGIRAATLKKYNRNTSPRRLQKLISSLDFDNPICPTWVILAVQDFLRYEGELQI